MNNIIHNYLFEKLQECNKRPNESWVNYAARYNAIIDLLNDNIGSDSNLFKYSKLTVVV